MNGKSGLSIDRASALAFAKAEAKVMVSEVSEESENKPVKLIEKTVMNPIFSNVMWVMRNK